MLVILCLVGCLVVLFSITSCVSIMAERFCCASYVLLLLIGFMTSAVMAGWVDAMQGDPFCYG